MKLRLDRSSPECGWEPFVEWLKGQGLVDAVTLDFDTDTLDAEVVLNEKRGGKRYLDSNGWPARKTKSVHLTSPPPLHPSRQAA
jgi:hypothetical protein